MGLFETIAPQLDLRLAVSDDIISDFPVYVKCREQNDKSRGNLAVYRDHLHCFGCGYHEARTVAGQAYLLKVDTWKAAELAPKYTAAALDGYRERVSQEARRDPLPASLADIYHGVLGGRRSHRLDWFKARGLADTIINAFQLGHDGMRFTIPVFDRENRLIALRYRRDDMYADENAPKYSGIKGRNGQYLFPENWLAPFETHYVVICEGELDAVRLWQEGIPAVTITNGAGQVHKIPALLKEQFPHITHIIIATDEDEPGNAARELTAQAAIDLGFQVGAVNWSQGKDITEALQLGSLNLDALRVYEQDTTHG